MGTPVPRNIHKTVIKRLLAGWLLLSVLIGGVVFYIETEQVDDFVLRLAVKESKAFTVHYRPGDSSRMEALREQAGEFLKGHFIVLELYDENKKKFLEAVDPDREAIEKQLKQHVHPFPLEEAVYYRKYWIDRQIFLQVLLPLKERSGRLIGYFEGVYQVDADTLKNIETQIAGTLILVVVVILATSVMLYPIILSLNRGLIRLSSDLLKGNIDLMGVLGSAIAKRDSDTNEHNYRVTIYAIRLAEALHLSGEQIRKLIVGAFLHDVGKIGISDNILLKPGKLTAEEFEVMRTHVTLGIDIIDKSEWLENARDVVEFHHERYDGSGYPRGLKGEQIPLNARIFAIVDVFDALTSRRPYKAPLPFEETMRILEEDRGTHLDPVLLDVFIGIARGLYAEVSAAEEEAVERLLDERVNQHFFHT